MLLAVDTSTMQMGLALFDGNRLMAESTWSSPQHHTIELAPALAEILKRAGIPASDLEALAIALGPGSFTALRVGMALVKGLAMARNLPVIGVPTLDVLAAAQPASTLRLAAVLQAGRGRITCAWYKPGRGTIQERSSGSLGSRWDADGNPLVTTVDALAKSIERPTLVAGELTTEERQRMARKKVNVVLAQPHLCVRRPAVLAELAWTRYQERRVDDLASLSPIYVQIAQPVQA